MEVWIFIVVNQIKIKLFEFYRYWTTRTSWRRIKRVIGFDAFFPKREETQYKQEIKTKILIDLYN